MYAIEQEKPPADFLNAWSAAGKHLERISDGAVQWLRYTLYQPYIEHLSFRLGNQLFFIHIEAIDGLQVIYPFTGKQKKTFINAAENAGAIPCVMHMKKIAGAYIPINPGWSLLHAISGLPVTPPELVTDAAIEISDWELHDFAIQVVRNYLEKEGKEITSWQSSLDIDPSLWFKNGDDIAYIIVRAARYPEKSAGKPANLADIQHGCLPMSKTGYFASVVAANADDPFDPDGQHVLPLYRGHGIYVKFEGLEPLATIK